MIQGKARRPNWGLTVAMSAAAITWQVYDMATATEAPSTGVLTLQWIVILCALVGGGGGFVMWVKQAAQK